MNAIIHVLSSTLVPLFFLGMIGSLLVVVVTVIRDMQEIFTDDEESE
jgi:hypothetical protein